MTWCIYVYINNPFLKKYEHEMFEIPIRHVLGDKTIEIVSNFLNCKIWLIKQTATTRRKRPHVIPLSLAVTMTCTECIRITNNIACDGLYKYYKWTEYYTYLKRFSASCRHIIISTIYIKYRLYYIYILPFTLQVSYRSDLLRYCIALGYP